MWVVLFWSFSWLQEPSHISLNVNFVDKNESTKLWRENGLWMTFPGALCGAEAMNQRDSYHHNSSLHLAYHFLFELFSFIPSGCRHITLCCSAFQGQSTVAWLTASKTLFYLLFLNNCLWASAVQKNVNGSDLKTKRDTQISLKVRAISENCTHGVQSQNTHLSA